MIARVLVLTLALVLAGYAVIERHDTRTCQDRSDRVFLEVRDAADAEREQLLDEFRDRCDGSHRLAIAAKGMAGAGGGLAPHAVRMADEAIRREPENYEGWVALAAALQAAGRDAAAQRTMREVRRLNPRFGQAPG